MFIDADPVQIRAAAEIQADSVELHTGQYALARDKRPQLAALSDAGKLVQQLGLVLHAGHGLTYDNVIPVAEIPNMAELNIGHSIVARSIMVGMRDAVAEMKTLITKRRS